VADDHARIDADGAPEGEERRRQTHAEHPMEPRRVVAVLDQPVEARRQDQEDQRPDQEREPRDFRGSLEARKLFEGALERRSEVHPEKDLRPQDQDARFVETVVDLLAKRRHAPVVMKKTRRFR
jgi:hypothetical protein